MEALFFDNFCVMVGVIVTWFAKGCSYRLDREVHKFNEGLSRRRANWREGIVGMVTIGTVAALTWVVCRIA